METDTKPSPGLDPVPSIKRAPAIACELAEFRRTAHLCQVPGDHAPEDARRPEYLWNYYRQLSPGDTVEIYGPKYQWLLKLWVIEIDLVGQGVICRELEFKDFREVAKPAVDLSRSTVEFKGEKAKWCVVNGTKLIKNGFATEADAKAWLAERIGQ